MTMAVEVQTFREQRSVGQAILRGLMCRCPNCGKGKVFGGYLKVNDTCSECGTKLSSARADDFPPYIAIFIVGHVLVGWMLHAEMSGPVDPMLYVWTMIPAAIVLPLVLLPPIKGAVIGLQWANYMYGFDPNRADTSKSDV
jgi:uncharacterized protein (DUF983 family)